MTFDKFISTVSRIILKHAPIKCFSRPQKRRQSKPWLTKGILTSIRHKQWLYKNMFLNGTKQEQSFFLNMQTILNYYRNKSHVVLEYYGS